MAHKRHARSGSGRVLSKLEATRTQRTRFATRSTPIHKHKGRRRILRSSNTTSSLATDADVETSQGRRESSSTGSKAEEDDAKADESHFNAIAPSTDLAESGQMIDSEHQISGSSLTRDKLQQHDDQWAGLLDGLEDNINLSGLSSHGRTSSDPDADFEVADDDEDYGAVDQISDTSDSSRLLEAEAEKDFIAHGDEWIEHDGDDWEKQTPGFENEIFGVNGFEYDRHAHEACLSTIETMTKALGHETEPSNPPYSGKTDYSPGAIKEESASTQSSQSPISSHNDDTDVKAEDELDRHLAKPNNPLDSSDSDTDIEPAPESTVSSPGLALSRTSSLKQQKSRQARKSKSSGKRSRRTPSREILKKLAAYPDQPIGYTETLASGKKQLRFILRTSGKTPRSITLRRKRVFHDGLHAHPSYLGHINSRLFQEHMCPPRVSATSWSTFPMNEFTRSMMGRNHSGSLSVPGYSPNSSVYSDPTTWDPNESMSDLIDLTAVGIDEDVFSAPMFSTMSSPIRHGHGSFDELTDPGFSHLLDMSEDSSEAFRLRLQRLETVDTTLGPDLTQSYLKSYANRIEKIPDLHSPTSPRKRKSSPTDIEMTSPSAKRARAFTE